MGLPENIDQLFDAFLDRFEKRGLMVVHRSEWEEREQQDEVLRLRKALRRKKALSFREIADGMLWTHSDGRKLNPRAVQVYAKEHAKPGELIKVPFGEREIWKLVISAVERLAIQRGNATL